MLLGPQTFVPLARLCKKQGADSPNTIEAETISLDDGLGLEGLPLFMLWDIVIDVFINKKEKQIIRMGSLGVLIREMDNLRSNARM